MREILNGRDDFESALRASEERFQLTFDQAAIGIAHVSNDGRWLRVNKKLCDIVGYSEDELRKLTSQDITHPDDLPADLAEIARVVAGGADQYSIEKRYIGKNGKNVWVSLRAGAVRDANRGVEYFVSIIEDISARKNAEAALRESEERLRSLVEHQTAIVNNMAEGLITVDSNGVVTSVNPSAEAIFGWTGEELLGRKMHEVTHYKRPDGSPFPANECAALRVLQDGVPLREREDVFIRKDGTFLPVIFSASPLRANGKIAGLVVGFRDDTQQRRVRTALRESQRRFREMIDALPAAIYTTDAEGRLTHFNPATVAFSGCLPELGTDEWSVIWKLLRSDGTLLPHDESPMAIALKEARIVDGVEAIAERPDGTKRWFTPYPRPLRDSDGRIIGGINMLVDITERKRAEKVISEAARQQKALFQLADELHRASSTDDIYNAALQAIFGALQCDRAAIQLRDDRGAMRFVSWRGLSADCRRALDGHAIWTADEMNPQPVCVSDLDTAALAEAVKIAAAAEGIRALAFIPLVSRGKLIGKFMTYFDAVHEFSDNDIELSLTIARQLAFGLERRRAEEALRQSEERFRAIVETTAECVKLVHPDGTLIHMNSAGLRMVGADRAEAVVGRSVYDLIAQEDRAAFKEFNEKICAGLRGGLEFDIVGLQGIRYRMETHAVPLRQADGSIVQLGVTRDISERKRIEQEREQILARERVLRVQAESASRLKDEFLATVSHELRTPLHAILGWSAILRDGVSAGQPLFPRAIEAIERNAKSQSQIVEDLLDVSRIISGKLLLDVKPLLLTPIVNAALDSIRPAADAKQIKFHVAIEPVADRLSADGARLQQIIWNLLSNSVKFTPSGGSVEVKVSRANDLTEISITDTGEGIKPEFLPFVFDRFRQADASTTRKHMGLGLGLAIVRHLVEMHGGTVEAESPGEGQGATFRIRLPLAIAQLAPYGTESQESATVAAVASTALGPSLIGINVLAVDDSEDTRELLRLVLRQYGANVLAVSSAREALETISGWKPDVLVCDIGMPEEDGYTFLTKVRALGRRKGAVPAIALTGYARPEDKLKAQRAGYQMFMTKPIDPNELATTIATLVGSRRDAFIH